jgi:CDK inhibitor PHO81
VFFGIVCGKDALHLPSPTTAWGSGSNPRRISSVGAAIEFAKANNLLGIFIDADLLVQVPSLIDGIRNVELLVGVHGATSEELVQENTSVTSDGDYSLADASIHDGVISFVDYSRREVA